MVEYRRIRSEPARETATRPEAKLTRTEIVRQIQSLLSSDRLSPRPETHGSTA